MQLEGRVNIVRYGIYSPACYFSNPYTQELHTTFPHHMLAGVSVPVHTISLPLTDYKLCLLFNPLEAAIFCLLLPLEPDP